MVTKQLLSSGSVFNIFVIFEDDHSQVAEFIDSLEEPDLGQFSHLRDKLNTHGVPQNECKFRNEGDAIYAIKTKNARVYGFFSGRHVFVLAVGFMKNATGGKKAERRSWKRARDLRIALT